MVAEEELISEGGSRKTGRFLTHLVACVCILWSAFQVWYASPLPFVTDFLVLNTTEARSIHLTFALFLCFLLFPWGKRARQDRVPWTDWVLAIGGSFCAAYLALFYDSIAERPGLPNAMDKGVAIFGVLILLEAARRALGPALTIVAGLFLFYAFGGPWMPDAIAHKGISLNKAVSHYWTGTEGVFGVALGVSTSMVFLFVLFGAVLERSGAGLYFIRSSFALLGRMRGGPAKAAVLSSAATGMVSGSSIANVVTTGTFTIPLMKKVGFPAHKTGAVECASSTNGQLTPPVMGAAAFLMVEYVGVSYLEVIRAAALPAILAYIALFYIVHLEALKLGIPSLEAESSAKVSRLRKWAGLLLGFGAGFSVVAAMAWGISLMRGAGVPVAVIAVSLVPIYLILVYVSSRMPDLPEGQRIERIPAAGPTLLAGLYFLLPIGVLVWCFAVEQLSPGRSAFWGFVALSAVSLTHRPIKAAFRRDWAELGGALRRGGSDCLGGFKDGARNMIGIAIATAAAGLIVGTVTVTGIGLVMTEFIDLLAGGNLMLVLLLTAVTCLILGMGLPTTANYIVVSTLMAPVVVALAGESGLAIPLIAVHMFVFYFGILADDTPPVGLGAYAAAAIARANPIQTGVQAFMYDIRTAILPFLFVFNGELLLLGVTSVGHLLLTASGALVGMLAFCSATQGYLLRRTRWWEVGLLLLVAFTFFRPGFWLDRFADEFESFPGAEIQEVADRGEVSELLLQVEGEDFTGSPVAKVLSLKLDEGADGTERLENEGIFLAIGEGEESAVVERVGFGSQADRLGLLFDFRIESVKVLAKRPDKEWFFVPALLLLAAMVYRQWGLNRRDHA